MSGAQKNVLVTGACKGIGLEVVRQLAARGARWPNMGGDAAPLSVEQGADTIVWLALDAPQSLTGKFLRERREIAW